MPEPIASLTAKIRTRDEAVLWACTLEATAPKVGNVHPGKSFENLTYAHFVTAAEITANCFRQTDLPISQRMLQAVLQTRETTATNVNLGIVLLLGPLHAADEISPQAIGEVLDALTEQDGEIIFDAIKAADAGGLEQNQTEWDVQHHVGPVDLGKAMQAAKKHDRIALQYASHFRDLLEHIVPVLHQAISRHGDLLQGICTAHLELLAQAPDSLIARKNGPSVASDVQQRASHVCASEPASVEAFDQFLRSRGNRLNPGTTADLIAAALYVLFRKAQQ